MRRKSTKSQATDEFTPLERAWSSTHGRAELLRLPAVPTLIVAPHPDDETLVAGGLIASLRARRVEVHVLAVTDGEHADATSDRDASAERREEQLAALDELGVGSDSVSRLALRSGSAAEHTAEIADAIAAFDHVGLVVAPWTGDHHRDHEAVGAAAREAVARTGSALIFGLFWTWHGGNPGDLAHERILALQLDADAQGRRRRAIECHRSQFAGADSENEGDAPLTQDLLRPLDWQAEYFVSPHARGGPAADDAHHRTHLVTGVPPVTSGPSEVQT